MEHTLLLGSTAHIWVAAAERHGPFRLSGDSQGTHQAQPGHGTNMSQHETRPDSSQSSGLCSEYAVGVVCTLLLS